MWDYEKRQDKGKPRFDTFWARGTAGTCSAAGKHRGRIAPWAHAPRQVGTVAGMLRGLRDSVCHWEVHLSSVRVFFSCKAEFYTGSLGQDKYVPRVFLPEFVC